MARGLYQKYRIERTDGKPLSGDRYFVLSMDSRDPHHREACRKAALAYADAIEPHSPELSADLRKLAEPGEAESCS